MIEIKEQERYDKELIENIARLHVKAFPLFFLTQLGVPFLRTLYASYLEDAESGIIVARDDQKVVGFIAYSNNYSRFFKWLVRHHLIKFAFCSLGVAMRHPSFIKRLLGAFKKSDSVVKCEKYVELASICVDPSIESRGIGSQMIDYLKSIVDFTKYTYINLETDADSNDGVNKFYVKNGFKISQQYTTAEGRKMNEYVYKPGVKV